jgi:hypothetical protein
LRRFLSAYKELAQKLVQLERKIGAHDEQIRAIFNDRQLRRYGSGKRDRSSLRIPS